MFDRLLRNSFSNFHLKPSLAKLTLLVVFSSGFITNLNAEVFEFGNEVETPLDELDTVPPQCEVETPLEAGGPFFVSWSCVDNYTPPENIISEIWVYKNDLPFPIEAGRFLGFPASKQIDAALLDSPSLLAALPLDIRLRSTDSSGNSALSDLITIEAAKGLLSQCSLSIVTETVAAVEGATGLPSLTVDTNNALVEATRPDMSSINLNSATAEPTANCEIDSICENEERISFAAEFSISEDNGLSGLVSVSPGSISVPVEGEAILGRSSTETSENLEPGIGSISATGETEIDGIPATLSLECAS